MKNNKDKKSLPFFGIPKLLPFVKPYRKLLLLMFICGFFSSSIDVLVPIFQRYALNHFIALNTLDTMYLFITLYFLVIIASAVGNYFACSKAMEVEVSVNRDLRNAAFHHLQELSLSYFNQNSVGYIHSRIMSDTSRIGGLVSWTFMECIWRSLYLIGSVAVMIAVNSRLAVMVLTIVPLVTVVFSLFQKKMILVNRQIRESNSMITGNFNEGITGAKTIKTLVIEDKMDHHFKEETSIMVDRSKKGAHLHGLFSSSMQLASSLALAIVLWKGGYLASSEIGTFSMFMSYAEGLMEPIRWLVDCISNLITTQVNIERLFKLLETEPDVKDSPEVIEKYGDCFHPKPENWEPIKGDITFKDVSFRYPDGEEYVLEHFNLDIKFGSHIAIVGETGAGKSTLVNLACRFFEPTQGQILIDGKDARERSQLWLHSAIGYVLQSPHLFSGTILDNLCYGNPNASKEEIDYALKLVSADQIIHRLEHGLQSNVGEGGDLLSTGEKQLLSFARAILANPKILILDEATASVDTVTEQQIQKATETIIKGRTTIMIAHRLSTIRNADLILVVRDGKIIEQGKHRELLAKKGYYYTLYKKQYEEDAMASIYNS